MNRADQNSRRMPWAAWLDSDSAVWLSCWRVCKASNVAASWFLSALTRLSAPVCRLVIRVLLKSCRVCTIDRLEPRLEEVDFNEARAEVSESATVLRSESFWTLNVVELVAVPAVRTPRFDDVMVWPCTSSLFRL